MCNTAPYMSIAVAYANRPTDCEMIQSALEMSSERQNERVNRSSRSRNQPVSLLITVILESWWNADLRYLSNQRREASAPAPSGLIFVQNKLPSDFAIPKLSTASPSDTPAPEEQQRRKPSPGDERLARRSRSTGIMSQERSTVPEGIPSSSLLEEIAISRFFHHYVSPTRTFFRLDLDFTHSVIDGASRRPVLAEAIIAMGILTLPNKDQAAYNAARLRHTRALRLTNKALQDSQYAKSDEVLMAVLLLGLYEVRDRCFLLKTL